MYRIFLCFPLMMKIYKFYFWIANCYVIRYNITRQKYKTEGVSFMNKSFLAADILLPKDADLEKWAVRIIFVEP